MTIAHLSNPLNKPVSEVISSSSDFIVAQCYKDSMSNELLNMSLIQGSIVKAVSSYDASYQVFGIVARVFNSSLDTIHKPSALGLTTKELQDLHPQIYDLLKKELEIYLFAFKENGHLINHPPFKPLLVHDFIYLPTKDEVLALSESFSGIARVVKKNNLRLELLVHLIKEGYELRSKDYVYLLRAGQELAIEFQDEIETLIPLLRSLLQLKE